MTKFKVFLGSIVGAVSGLALTLSAHAQSIPVWNATDTVTIASGPVQAFKDTFLQVFPIIAEYAVIISLVVGLVWFFVRLARKH